VSTGYQVLVLLHVLCIIGGFGTLSYNALYLNLARRSVTRAGASAILESNTIVSSLAEILVYAGLLFGIGAVAASHSAVRFSDDWVSGAFGAYLVDVAILHGWIRPHHRHMVEVARRAQDANGDGAGAAEESKALVAELARLERRASAGWAAFNALVVVAVYLMVFKPGS
jgi:hypothetical protein